MKIQLTASLAVLFLALIGPKGTLGSPIEQRVGKEESKSVDTNEDHAIPYRGAHHGPIAAVAPDIGADESISVPSYSPLSDGGCGYTSEERDGSTVLDLDNPEVFQNERYRSKRETGDEDASNLVSGDDAIAAENYRHYLYTIATTVSQDGILHLCPDNGKCVIFSPDTSVEAKRLPNERFESKRESGDQDPNIENPEVFQNELCESERENRDKDDSNLESPEIFHIGSENADGQKVNKRAELAVAYKSPDPGDPYDKVYNLEVYTPGVYDGWFGKGRQHHHPYTPFKDGSLD